MPPIPVHYEPAFQTYYQSYYQELSSEAILSRWQRIDTFTVVLVAATASGSAIGAWAVWLLATGQIAWAIISGAAAIAAIVHGTMQVPGRVKTQGELRRMFLEVRLECETFLQKLTIGLDALKADSELADLRKKYTGCMTKTSPDIGFTNGLQHKVQRDLDARLSKKGLIDGS